MLDLQGVATAHEAGSKGDSLVDLPLLDLQSGHCMNERCHQGTTAEHICGHCHLRPHNLLRQIASCNQNTVRGL